MTTFPSSTFETLENRNLFAAVGLDTGFGDKGVVTTEFSGVNYEGASAAVVLDDGRVLVAGGGTADNGDHAVFALYDKKGALSKTFDGDGKLTLSAVDTAKFGGLSQLQLFQAPDGNVIVGGDKALLKLKLTGTIDTKYGTSGFAAALSVPNFPSSRASIELSNGTVRQAGYDDIGRRLYLRDIDANGKVKVNVQRTLNLIDARAMPDVNGVTVVDTSTKVYRYQARNLQKVSSFGTGGVVDLTNAFNKWADTHGPFYDGDYNPEAEKPPVKHPPFGLYDFFDASSGIGINGSSGYVSDKAEHDTSDGHEAYSWTPLTFTVSTDGKKVTVDDGYPKGSVLAHNRVTISNEYGDGYNADIYTRSGAHKTLEVPAFYDQPYATRLSTTSAVATDGSVYVAGLVGVQNADGDIEYRFAVVHTKVP